MSDATFSRPGRPFLPRASDQDFADTPAPDPNLPEGASRFGPLPDPLLELARLIGESDPFALRKEREQWKDDGLAGPHAPSDRLAGEGGRTRLPDDRVGPYGAPPETPWPDHRRNDYPAKDGARGDFDRPDYTASSGLREEFERQHLSSQDRSGTETERRDSGRRDSLEREFEQQNFPRFDPPASGSLEKEFERQNFSRQGSSERDGGNREFDRQNFSRQGSSERDGGHRESERQNLSRQSSSERDGDHREFDRQGFSRREVLGTRWRSPGIRATEFVATEFL